MQVLFGVGGCDRATGSEDVLIEGVCKDGTSFGVFADFDLSD